MKTRWIALVVLAALLLSILAACGNNGFLTSDKAQKLALKDMGVKASQTDSIHTHAGSLADGTPIYSIHITVDGETYEYVIQASNGEILSSGLSEGDPHG